MALVKCNECGGEVSNKATACPKCGAPIATGSKKRSSWGCGTAIVVVVLAGVIGTIVADCSAESERRARAEQQKSQDKAAASARKKNVEEFLRNPEPTIAKARQLHAQGNWSQVVQVLKPFLETGNQTVVSLHNDALERRLVAAVAKIPSSNVDANFKHYSELARLRPENETYARKRDVYKSRVEEQRTKDLAEKLRFGTQPVRSPWDGSYREVKAYLERVANDPDSIEFVGCTEVFKNQDGWLVGCHYRGTNAFGAKILTANWFRIQRSQVVEVYDHDRFRWPGE